MSHLACPGIMDSNRAIMEAQRQEIGTLGGPVQSCDASRGGECPEWAAWILEGPNAHAPFLGGPKGQKPISNSQNAGINLVSQ